MVKSDCFYHIKIGFFKRFLQKRHFSKEKHMKPFFYIKLSAESDSAVHQFYKHFYPTIKSSGVVGTIALFQVYCVIFTKFFCLRIQRRLGNNEQQFIFVISNSQNRKNVHKTFICKFTCFLRVASEYSSVFKLVTFQDNNFFF